ncbi:MAG: VWA domain-containing protein [Clostridia bacterium]|nr:VWA domain-containing protein [Clostridia bacterium]
MPPIFSQFKYNVDIVMCIDATASMGPILDEVKRTALDLPQMFLSRMAESGKHSDSVRFKVIGFRDFGVDSAALIESDFFEKDEANKLEEFVRNLEPLGGGDIPENSLEAIATAIKSDWLRVGTKRRHVIIVFTDAPALDPSARRSCKNYPKSQMPESLMDLTAWWEGNTQMISNKMDPKGKRLVLFAPLSEAPWSDIKNSWTGIVPQDIAFASGGSELDMDAIIALLVNSV